ncbi:MAG TPA: histidine--tRNA ligase [Acidobacteriota bacterium]|nr:histidine--tRNA ligase [Acidobacteriota bacterium]
MDETLLNNLPGTRDLLPEEIASWQLVEDNARRIFACYGFQEIRTPILEATELFARGIGGDTDIVGKEMYTFEDQSGKSITLRPEATASVVRAYAQHSMYRAAGIAKLYYVGAMFRHEKKQKGRWRQFYQIGAEVLGSDNPAIEAEVIEMVLQLLEAVSVRGRLLINSVGDANCRPGYVEILRNELGRHQTNLCEDCRRRTETNPLRVLDCKVESCQPYIQKLPRITDHLCSPCNEHFKAFRSHLEEAGIPYEIVPRLVRGLDYYVRTAFEIASGDLGAQNALVGGGRYDGLSEILGGPPVPGFGFAMGLDRLVMILPEKLSDGIAWKPAVFIAFLGEPAFRKALSIAAALRKQGNSAYVEFTGGSLKSQLRLANKLRARHVVIIGDSELAREKYQIRRMADSTQWEITLPELVAYLQSHENRQ